jgi:hypothetical protein
MVLVEPETVVTEAIDLFPCVQVLRVGADRDVRLEVPGGERVGQFVADFQVVEMFAVRQQIEHEDPHGTSALTVCSEYGEGRITWSTLRRRGFGNAHAARRIG